MKTVLVVYASRMRSTQEIAAAIGDQLVSRGFEVEVMAAVDAANARGFDAVLLGSAVYMGQWDKHAVDYLRREATDLARRPTWLFQSGPSGPAAENGHTGLSRAVNGCAAPSVWRYPPPSVETSTPRAPPENSRVG